MNIKYILLATFGLYCLSSCIEDKGSYGNIPVNEVSVSGLENGDILGGVKDGNLVLSQGSHTQTISVSSTDTVLALINKINATADFEAGLDASEHFYIQSKHESTEAIKIDTSNAVNIDEILGLTAGTFTGSLTESLGAQGHIQVTGTVGLTPDTNNGVQTGNFFQ